LRALLVLLLLLASMLALLLLLLVVLLLWWLLLLMHLWHRWALLRRRLMHLRHRPGTTSNLSKKV